MPPVWHDPDQNPFPGPLEEYFSPFGWDAANQTIFRPISRFFAVDPASASKNVNALDEVPDSSWFQGRIGKDGMTPAEVGQGSCPTAPIDPSGPWTVKGAKPNGANPGFLIKAQDGKRYLLKFDGVSEGPRPTAADVVGSRLYHAAGYFVPCNRIVHFDRKILEFDPEAEVEDDDGNDVALQPHHLDQVFAKAIRMSDGRYRANASLFIEGKPIGPWTYQGVREDDLNDVIPHEDRRELRGSALFAAWTNHFDAREQNTLAAWMDLGGGLGYVRHYLIDFGDSFGSIWEPPMLGRRIGHANYLDVGYMAEDFVTLGTVERPWDTARFGPTGATFGYYNVEQFVPDAWHPGYPNPAFSRMQEADAAWAARIIAQFTDEHIRAMVAEAKLPEPSLVARLTAVLIGRRDKLLRRYLTKLSPLTKPTFERGLFCMDDLALMTGVVTSATRQYAARVFTARGGAELRVYAVGEGRVCTDVPRITPADGYGVIDVWAFGKDHTTYPLRTHVVLDDSAVPPNPEVRGQASVQSAGGQKTRSALRVIGIERPESHEPFEF